jgi:hypothetical protein
MFGLNFNIASDYFVTLQTETIKSAEITQSRTRAIS